MEDIILVGYGGHGRSVADCIERGEQYKIIGYTDMEQYESSYLYLGRDEVLGRYRREGVENVFVSIGYMGKDARRECLYQQLQLLGFAFPVIADPSAIISKTAKVGEGTFIGKGAIINAEAELGKMCIINTRALIEHECHVGDFSHVAVGAILCGKVSIGKGTFVGANATIIQEIELPERTFVPAGEVIRRS